MRRRRSELRWWLSGRILACHAADRGSIPRQRKNNVFEKKNYCDGMLMQLQMDVLDSFYTILIPCGLVVRIWRFHRHGPGSIPGMGIFLSTFKILFKDVSYRTR